MPYYQFICSKCKTEFEEKVKYDDSSLVNCPKCGGRVYRKFTAVPIIFKGSGFYCTDNQRAGS